MIHFEWLWVLLALPLPWLLRRVLPSARPTGSAALRVPAVSDYLGGGKGSDGSARSRRLLWLAIPAWLLLLCAAARPQWQGDLVELPVSGRDLMLAVDISGSMQQRDFRLDTRIVDRLTATKVVAAEFIRRRQGDRLGLILFGRQAYMQTPLTFDVETVKTLLLEAEVGFAGKETAIGDAIGLAIKRLRSDEAQQQVLILLTDGANTAGEVEPLKAAELAAGEGLRIHTIGIGSDRGQFRSLFGTRSFMPASELDEETLTAIAEATGGRYFRARDTAELARIYSLLDELEPLDHDMGGFRPRRSLFMWPLGAAVLLVLLLLLSELTPRRSLERAT